MNLQSTAVLSTIEASISSNRYDERSYMVKGLVIDLGILLNVHVVFQKVKVIHLAKNKNVSQKDQVHKCQLSLCSLRDYRWINN